METNMSTVNQVQSSGERLEYSFPRTILKKSKVIDYVQTTVVFQKSDGKMSDQEKIECLALGKNLLDYHELVADFPKNVSIGTILETVRVSCEFMAKHKDIRIDNWNVSHKY